MSEIKATVNQVMDEWKKTCELVDEAKELLCSVPYTALELDWAEKRARWLEKAGFDVEN